MNLKWKSVYKFVKKAVCGILAATLVIGGSSVNLPYVNNCVEVYAAEEEWKTELKNVLDNIKEFDGESYQMYPCEINVSSDRKSDVDAYLAELMGSAEYYWIDYASDFDLGYGFCLILSVKKQYINADSSINKEQAIRDYAHWQYRISSLMQQIDNQMTALEKILAVHEWVVRECEYDYKNYLEDTIPEESYRREGVILNGLAVCSGYTRTMKYLLNLIGIQSEDVSSDTMNHAWNIVKIGNDYYHLDTTWDDWGKDESHEGVSYKKYFLKSDNEIKQLKHFGWVSDKDTQCEAEDSFKGYIFRENNYSNFSYHNGWWYYKNDSSVMKSKIDGKQQSIFKTFDKTVVNMFIYKNYMYVATNDKVYKINMADAGSQTVIFDSSKENGFEQGIDEFVIKQDKIKIDSGMNSKIIPIDNNTTIELHNQNLQLQVEDMRQISAAVKSDYNTKAQWVSTNSLVASVDSTGKVTAKSEGTAKIIVMADGVTKECEVVVNAVEADANSDGKVNSKDVVMMKKHLAGIEVDINLAACDVNADEKFDSKDVVKTMKKLAGYDVVLGEK